MKVFNWNAEKNEYLKKTRNISFEEIIIAILNDRIIEVYDHYNKVDYSNQKIYEVIYNDYVYLVPFVANDNEVFLKTIIPSRKATKKYKKEGEKND